MNKLTLQLIFSISLLFFVLLPFASPTQAGTVAFDCSKSGGITDAITIDCKPVNADYVSPQLKEFAVNAFIMTSGLPNNNCSSVTAGAYDCLLNSTDPALVAAAPPPQFKFNCLTSSTQNNLTSNCNLDKSFYDPKLSNVMQMDCQTDDLTGAQGRCKFSVDSTPLIDKLKTDAGFNGINTSIMADSFFNCLQRTNVSDTNQIECDTVIEDLLRDQRGIAGLPLATLIDLITPKRIDLSLDISMLTLMNSNQSIFGRLNQLRNHQTGNAVNLHIFTGNQWLKPNSLIADSSATSSDVSPEQPARNMSEYGKLGVFLNGTALKSTQESTQLETSNDADTQIATFGMDYRFTDQWIAGIGMNIGQSAADVSKNSGKLDSTNTSIIVYSSYYLNSWYFDGSLHAGKNHYEQERNVDCSGCTTAFKQSYSADFDGSETLVSLGSGYQWQIQQWGITPFMQFNSANISIDKYSEAASSSGTGAAYALTIDKHERTSNTFKIGSNIQYVISSAYGVFIPAFGIYAAHDFENNSDIILGRFAGNTSTLADFNLATNDVDTDYIVTSGGLSFQMKNGNAGFFQIQSIEGYAKLSQIQYTAGWRWEL